MLAYRWCASPDPAAGLLASNLMRMMTGRWVFCVVAAAVTVVVLPAPAGPAPQVQTCPPGQHEDTETPGFQCVVGWCPAGMLLDTVNQSCVAAPGVPPPALPNG